MSVFVSARGEEADVTMKMTKALAVVDETVNVHLNHPSRHGVIVAITFADTSPV